MKKILVFLLAMVMVICLTACGDKKTEGGNDGAKADAMAEAATKYGIDLAAEGEQKMSETRAAMAVLVETKDVWLEGSTMFFDSDKTYADFVEHIGCDANFYSYSNGSRNFTWVAEGDDNAKLQITFKDNGKGWVLSASGSVNIK